MLIPVCVIMVMAGCSGQPTQEQIQASRYHIANDRAHKDIDVRNIPDAVPRPPAGDVKTDPYSLNGKTYTPRSTAAGYVRKGTASWYGAKFHGYKTANGEIYDMYGMTAAHKTLPLPSYVRITNLENNRSVIVRVNDRGPFHGNRLIDLSWAAAKKLGYQSKGVAQVKIEGIDTSPEGMLAFKRATQKTLKSGTDADSLVYLQVAALSSKDGALSLKQRLLAMTDTPVQVIPSVKDKLFRVRMGPFSSDQDLLETQSNLEKYQLGKGHRVFD
ncbi:septal ring lytic transglycosylase RlpA family protein [Parendozoicomonas sp. Alg238-R29]|uniref:septal ring lytic transglycosylase RlpA family protein n=1 Tax=Parendozoicomonas sp. Alg238-R29 TaxID=2993446 RepID=UPI00248D6790|nr:septal ring lytic transglycosylase RlpA family protein [Parendozoicomonas sp. Alg238-R29]